MTRLGQNEYFLEVADVVSRRSTCLRLAVGCVLVVQGHIVATGYNGAPKGLPHCTVVGCDMGPAGGCVRTVHAEINAVIQAALHGVSTRGAEAYVTCSPCGACVRALINAGIKHVHYRNEYRDRLPLDLLKEAGIGYQHHPKES